MPKTEVKRLVSHAWRDIYDLVMDVKEYPHFVPFCRAISVLERHERENFTEVLARMEVGFGVFRERYTSRITGIADERQITIRATDGPFDHLDGQWLFRPDGDARTEISFEVDYEFRNPILAFTAGRVFKSIFGDFVRAFEKRANEKFRR
jgi:coenzyme Q-binding protein COQ10